MGILEAPTKVLIQEPCPFQQHVLKKNLHVVQPIISTVAHIACRAQVCFLVLGIYFVFCTWEFQPRKSSAAGEGNPTGYGNQVRQGDLLWGLKHANITYFRPFGSPGLVLGTSSILP